VKQIVNRYPFAESFREITPGRSGSQHPENAINDQSPIDWRPPGSGWFPNNIHDQLPLIVRQSVPPNHHKPSVTDEQNRHQSVWKFANEGFLTGPNTTFDNRSNSSCENA
jgi:hypothetical protein